MEGLDNLPTSGGAMLLYYHGTIPIDYYYLIARLLLVRGVVVHSVVDHFLFSIPGFRIILEAFRCTPGTVESCAQVQ